MKVLPANLVYESTNYIIETAEQKIYVGATLQSSMHYVLSSDFNGEYELSNVKNVTGMLIDNKDYQIGGTHGSI